MGKTSRRGELEDREAEEEDSGSQARGKMGQISTLSFVIIPETISSLFYFHFEVSHTFNDCQAFFQRPPTLKLQREWPEVLKSSRGLYVRHHYLVFEEDTKVTYKTLEGKSGCL